MCLPFYVPELLPFSWLSIHFRVENKFLFTPRTGSTAIYLVKVFRWKFLAKAFCALKAGDGSEAIMLVMDVQLNPLISSSHASATVSSRAELN